MSQQPSQAGCFNSCCRADSRNITGLWALPGLCLCLSSHQSWFAHLPSQVLNLHKHLGFQRDPPRAPDPPEQPHRQTDKDRQRHRDTEADTFINKRVTTVNFIEKRNRQKKRKIITFVNEQILNASKIFWHGRWGFCVHWAGDECS